MSYLFRSKVAEQDESPAPTFDIPKECKAGVIVNEGPEFHVEVQMVPVPEPGRSLHAADSVILMLTMLRPRRTVNTIECHGNMLLRPAFRHGGSGNPSNVHLWSPVARPRGSWRSGQSWIQCHQLEGRGARRHEASLVCLRRLRALLG